MAILEVVNATTGKAIEVDTDTGWARLYAVLDAFTPAKALARAVEVETIGGADNVKRAYWLRSWQRKLQVTRGISWYTSTFAGRFLAAHWRV